MNFGYYPYQNNNPYQQQLIQQMQAQQSNNNFVHVPSEDVARAYSVAPGGSVTFINDNAPYCYTKTVGFSQFDTPVFRKFRLVEETNSSEQPQAQKPQQDRIIPENPEILSEIETLKARVESLESRFNESKPVQQNERKMKNESFGKQQQQKQ